MNQTVITCTICNKKLGEQEIKPGDHIRFYCDSCKKAVWYDGELKIRKLVEYEKEE